jgi:hypothetical protein
MVIGGWRIVSYYFLEADIVLEWWEKALPPAAAPELE